VESAKCHTPDARRCPIFGRCLLTAAVSLRPATRDNPGEMGGRVASPTFVGRVEELQALEAARGRVADADPAVVLVGGEAGVGKTRLIAELTARCAAEGMWVLVGGCVPVGNGALPYAPIVQALRVLLAEVGVGAVRELVGPSWPELARLLPALGEPDRSGRPDQADHARLFELLLGLLGRLGEQAPLVLVVEDLHWADQSTRDLLAFLVRNVRRERVLVVITHRNDEPGQQRLGPYLAELDRGGPMQRLEVPRLNRAQTAVQLTGILGAAPAAALVDGVFARSEGNPFFTEELLAAVQAGSRELPPTVGDLLRGRVQALSEPARQVLAVVAVAGRPAPHQLLAAIAGLDGRALVTALREAVAHQLLVTRPGEDGYTFRHALLGEVVEADLLPGERTRLHAACAQALASWPELGEAASAAAKAELAVHWDAAGEPARALPARVEAGIAAERARAFPEAARHYQRALELWTLVPEPGRPAGLDRVDLLTRAADAVALAGTVEHAISLLEEALRATDCAVEPVRAAVLLARLGDHRRMVEAAPAALAAYEAAERLLAGASPSAEGARVLAAHALALLATWRPEEAISPCEEAIRIARAVGDRAEEARALNILGGCLTDLGEMDRAIGLLLEARRIAEEVGEAETVVRTYVDLCYALALAGRGQDALADAQDGYLRACQLGLEHATGSLVAAALAWQLLDSGRWGECERLLGELLSADSWDAFELHSVKGRLLTRRGAFTAARTENSLAVQLSPPTWRAFQLQGVAELALWQGHHDEAETAVAEGLRWWSEYDPAAALPHLFAPWAALTFRLEADRATRAAARQTPDEVAAARQRAAPVLAALDRLTAAASPQAAYPEVACNLLLARAELSRLEGRSDPEGWQTSAAAWERLERPFEAAYAGFHQAEALLAGGVSRPQVEPILRRAHQTAVTLGAGPLRREIELLAQRGRLRLDEHAQPSAAPRALPSPATSLGLTRREVEVLTLVAEGRTNRQIGQALFITPKTAGVHVSRILAKLGVAHRGEAAAIAHQLGLDRR
jgi:DNA-binding CsgD family transcriptional regulator/tetratricopeptide (TPR) repeat protein